VPRCYQYIEQNFAKIIRDITMANGRHHDTFCLRHKSFLKRCFESLKFEERLITFYPQNYGNNSVFSKKIVPALRSLDPFSIRTQTTHWRSRLLCFTGIQITDGSA